MSGALPQKFSDLEPLVDEGWSLATMNQRMEKRRTSTSEELQSFYDRIMPRVMDIVEYMDQFEYPEAPEDAHRLFYLLLTLAEIAPHVEQFGGSPRVPYSFDEKRFVVAHGDVPGHRG